MAKKPESMEAERPLPITTNFGREDLNELRDMVNYLISRLT